MKCVATLSASVKAIPRQALHAETLGFVHFATWYFARFDLELPEDMRPLLEKPKDEQ